MVAVYVPDIGDIVWLTLDPTQGHEQAGRRPALVLTPKQYNAKTNLAVCCPVTNRSKNYPFEIPLDAASGVTGVVLVDQVKSLDWVERRADLMGSVGDVTLDAVRQMLKTLLATP